LQTRFPRFKIFAARTDGSTRELPELTKDTRLLVVSDIPTQQHAEMLEKMIGAVKLDMHQEACLVTVSDRVSLPLASTCRGTSISEVLVFGTPPASLGLHLQWPNYHPVQIGGLQILFAPSLDRIAAAKDLKLQLWQGLQQLFTPSA
jgi:DNA polymerase III psi subunit